MSSIDLDNTPSISMLSHPDSGSNWITQHHSSVVSSWSYEEYVDSFLSVKLFSAREKNTSTVRETKNAMLMGTGMRGRKSPHSFLVPEEAPPLLSCVSLLGANELCLFMDQLIHNRKYLLISIQTT